MLYSHSDFEPVFYWLPDYPCKKPDLLEQELLETEEPQLETEQEELNTVPDLIIDPRDGEKTPEEVFGAYEDYLNNNNTEENK